jgi:hypothetical protein
MSETDYTIYQKNVCEQIPEPPPLKKFCPSCVPNKNYVEPDWTKNVGKPYLNEKTCEYMVAVTINKNGKSVTLGQFQSENTIMFKNYEGKERNRMLRSFIQPALVLMLRYQGKLVADQIMCANFNGPTLEGMEAEELLEGYSDFKTVYGYLKDDPIGNLADAAEVYMNGPQAPAERPCADLILPETFEDLSELRVEPGQPFNLTDAIVSIKSKMPQITNPFALELYAYVKEFFIEPTGGPLKVLIAIPAFVLEGVPDAPNKKELQESAATTKSEVEIDVSKFFGQVIRLTSALMVFGKYQSHFYQTQDGFVVFKTPGKCSDGKSENEQECFDNNEIWSPEKSRDYYASNYSKKVFNFYDRLKEVSKDNGYNLRSEIPSVIKKNAEKLKIKFDSSDPSNPYKIEEIRAKMRGCPYETFNKSMDKLQEFTSDPTVINYFAKIVEIDTSLQAKKSPPWLDFLIEFTFPVLSVSYGNLNSDAIEDTAGSCVKNEALKFGVDLKDFVLDEVLSLLEVFQFTYNSVGCTSFEDDSKEPETVEFDEPDGFQKSKGKKAKQELKGETRENKQEKLESDLKTVKGQIEQVEPRSIRAKEKLKEYVKTIEIPPDPHIEDKITVARNQLVTDETSLEEANNELDKIKAKYGSLIGQTDRYEVQFWQGKKSERKTQVQRSKRAIKKLEKELEELQEWKQRMQPTELLAQEYISEVKKWQQILDDLEDRKEKLEKQIKRGAKLSRKEKKKARAVNKETNKDESHPYVLKAREMAYEKIATQDSLLTTLYNFDDFQEQGFAGIKGNDLSSDKTFEDVFKRMSLCNAKTLTIQAMRCLFSGVTEEDALSKIIKSTLSAMDVDVFGIFIKNLPPEVQAELKEKIAKEFNNLPLPWEEGYDAGEVTNNYLIQLKAPKKQERKAEKKEKKLQDRKSDIVNKYLKKDKRLTPLEKDWYENQKEIDELKWLKSLQTSESIDSRRQSLEKSISDTEIEIVDLEIDASEGIPKRRESLAELKALLSSYKEDLDNVDLFPMQEELDRLENTNEKIIKKIERIEGKKGQNSRTALQDEFDKLTEEQKASAGESLSSESRARINNDPDRPGSAGTYGTALGNAQELITQAYIDWIMEKVSYEELYVILDRFPGSEVVSAILADFGCATQGMFNPPLKSFMSTLAFDTCGGPAGGFTLPSVQPIPNFSVGGFILPRLRKLFVEQIENLISEIIKKLMLKLLETVDTKLCESVQALGKGLANVFSPDGFDDAMREAFCPDADDNDLKDIKDNLLDSAGVGDGLFRSPNLDPNIEQASFDCLYKVLNSILSKNEYMSLFCGGRGNMNPDTLRKIAEAVNAFCPEFKDVLGYSEKVAEVFMSMMKFMSPALRDVICNELQGRQDQDGPIFDAVCLTQEEYDQWNRNRENLLTDQGLDPETAREMIDQANGRVLDDLGTLSDMLAKGPDGMVKDALDKLFGPKDDPDCIVPGQGLVLEDEEEREDKSELMKGFFEMLEKGFYRDLISRPSSVLNNILRDTNNARLGGHERRVNLPRFYPNYVNSDPDFEFRKENGPWIVQKMLKSTIWDEPRGQFPDTVGKLVIEQLGENDFVFNTIPGEPAITMTFQAPSDDSDDPEYEFELEYSVVHEAADKKEIVVDQTIVHTISSLTLEQLSLDSIASGETIIEGEDIEIENLSTNVDKYHTFDYEDYKNEYSFQARIFKSFLDNKVGGNINTNGSLNEKFSEINTSIMNFARNAVISNPDGGIPNGFKFGYAANQKITYADLLYVNPDSDPGDPQTWEYTYSNEDQVLGKSATENPRVHFLDPKIHGGSYKRPFKYIEPATYDGWLGMIRTFIPEVKECDEMQTGFLDVPNLSKRAKDVEGKIEFDERLSYVFYCQLEAPYDKIAAPATHGIMEGVILATSRIYATEFILRSLGVFCSVEFSNLNLDNTYMMTVMADFEEQMIEETNRWNIVQGYVYYLLFLEQAVQTVQRQIKDGLMEETPEIKAAFDIIDAAQKNYDPMDLDSAMDGAAIIAFGKEAFNKETGELDRDNWDIPKILWKMKSLTIFKMRLATKIKVIQDTKDQAEIIFGSLLKKVFTESIEKINLNMRPRPHVQNIQKYLLSRNGLVFASSLRSGEMKVEQTVFEGESGIDYGNIPNVVRDVYTENPLSELQLNIGAEDISIPGDLDPKEFFKEGAATMTTSAIAGFVRGGLEGAIPIVSDFLKDKISQTISVGRSGIFYLEKYLRVFPKGGTDQVYNIKEFQEMLKDGLIEDMSQKVSDVFGNASVVDDQLTGTIGIKFGVRLVYSPPGEFDYEIPQGREKERTYKLAASPVKLKFKDSFYELIDNLDPRLKEYINPALDKLEVSIPSIQRAIPLVVFEQDIMDRKMDEINLDDPNFGEDLKCYVDNLCDLQDYRVLFDYCFPVRSYVSLFGVYCYYAFFNSIGKGEGETAEEARGFANDRWKSKVFKRSKKTLRQLFNSTYRTDGEAKKERKGKDKDKYAKFLTNILPQAYLNLDMSSVKFWQAFRIIEIDPFDADGNSCKNDFQKMFD